MSAQHWHPHREQQDCSKWNILCVPGRNLAKLSKNLQLPDPSSGQPMPVEVDDMATACPPVRHVRFSRILWTSLVELADGTQNAVHSC